MSNWNDWKIITLKGKKKKKNQTNKQTNHHAHAEHVQRGQYIYKVQNNCNSNKVEPTRLQKGLSQKKIQKKKKKVI